MSMTNSQIKLADSESVKMILNGYLEGQVRLSHLREALNGYILIDFDLAPDKRIIQEIIHDESIKIPVKNKHLCQMLRRYIAGEISELDLSNWAALIVMAPFFVPEGGTEEERWQAGEGPLWEVLQRLVAPSVYSGINFDIAHTYLDLLTCTA